MFENLVKKETDHALTYAYGAMIDMMLYRDPSDNIEKALASAKKGDYYYYFTLALCHFAKNDFSNCELNISEFLARNPNDMYGKHVLGFTRIDLDRPEEGLEVLNNLIKNNPAYYPAYNHIGYAYLKLGQYKNAQNAFTQFLHGDSLNHSALDSFAEYYVQTGEYDKAIALLTQATLIEPHFAYGWEHMGDIFRQSGKPELAILAYEKAKTSAMIYGTNFVNSINRKINSLR
jgi:tetratricopeptide (TPR) repeat protein